MRKHYVLRGNGSTIRSILVILLFVLFNKDINAIGAIYWAVTLGCSGLLLFLSGGTKKIRVNNFLCWYVLFVSLSALSLAWAIDDSLAITALKSMIVNLIIILALDNSVRREEDILVIMEAVIFAISLVSLYLIIKIDWTAVGQNRIGVEITGKGWNANEIGLMGLWAIALCLIHPLKKQKLYLWALCLIPNMTVLFFSGSRKAWLAFVLVLILYLYVHNQRRILRTCFIAVCIFSIAVYLAINVPILYEIAGKRFESMLAGVLGRGEVDSSTLLRQAYAEFGWENFLRRPLLGYGLNCFRRLLSMSYIGKETYSHNNYVEILVNGGVITAVVFYSVYVLGIFRGIYWIKTNKARVTTHYTQTVFFFMGLLILQLGLQIGMVMYQDVIMLIILMLYNKLLHKRKESSDVLEKNNTGT